jgi:hypothetical protein
LARQESGTDENKCADKIKPFQHMPFQR